MKLRVIQGKRRGKEFAIGTEPVLIGRDPSAGILLTEDQLVSSRHAEVAQDADGQLVVRDLDSVNGTEVNGERIESAGLGAGDELTIGNTVFEVIEEAVAPPSPPPSRPKRERRAIAPLPAKRRPPPQEEIEEIGTETAAEEEAVEEAGEAERNLEFGEQAEVRARAPASLARRILSLSLTALITVVILGGGVYIWMQFQQTKPRMLTGSVSSADRLDLAYEKVQASKDNIFRYALRISGSKLMLNIDDLKQRRHLQKEKTLKEGLTRELVGQLERNNFNNLKAKYGGLPAEQQETSVIELTRGTRYQRVEVDNTIPPDIFVSAQKTLEEFAKNELGLVGDKPREQLIQDAQEAFLAAKRLYEAREVEFPNLYNSIKAFQLVQLNLETIEPKPEIYRQAVALESEATDMLKQLVDNLRFNVDKAVRLSEWTRAREALQQIMARVPDREDDRYREAERRLIIVQQHLRR
ncbi:MAG: FHA domain-containing protein [Verrucomicrobia bacterium]|nr:FHA domain-containing protein [Verrucomicrobiota bacterium]